MDDRDWLQLGDIIMARYAYAGKCAANVFEDRVREMTHADYQALLDRLDDQIIAAWVRRTREETKVDQVAQLPQPY